MKSLQELTRPNIWSLAPYSSARNEYAGREARVFLDANENPYNQPFNRYPDPLQLELKAALSKVKGVPAENIFLGNGSDEAIDLPYRCFCNPGVDNVVAIEPTYGMYKVCADINDVEYRTVLLDERWMPPMHIRRSSGSVRPTTLQATACIARRLSRSSSSSRVLSSLTRPTVTSLPRRPYVRNLPNTRTSSY